MGSMSAVLTGLGSMPTILTVATPEVIRHPSGIPPGSRTGGRLSSGMEELAERLSQLDAQAEGTLRVVLFYDTLIQRRVDLLALARASAALAECVAGVPGARPPCWP
jgi:hypothetical protein